MVFNAILGGNVDNTNRPTRVPVWLKGEGAVGSEGRLEGDLKRNRRSVSLRIVINEAKHLQNKARAAKKGQ